MNENEYRACTPEQYIRKLFEETRDGKLTIHSFPILDQAYSCTYKMNWTKQDAERTVRRYLDLTSALTRIGELHDALREKADREALLSLHELAVWDTYVRPFEPFEVDLDVIADLYFRREGDSLEDEENDLLERHHEWFVSNSRKRLPYDRRCPSQLINRAQRYEALIRRRAPETLVAKEGRFLAEEMVLYYHATKELSFDSLKFLLAQMKTYEAALGEVKSGKKKTHWMWFIFPQLRGLGSSDKASTYGIADLDEASAYLSHPTLGARLIEISTKLLNLDESDATAIFGDVDGMKLRSSMTLFACISKEDSVFHRVLHKFFGGQSDPRTMALLENQE